MIFPFALYQINQADEAANILFDRGVLGVIVFVLFGVCVWIYRDSKTQEKEHKNELKEVVLLYQKQNSDMIKVVEQSNSTLQTLINNFQINEAIEETLKEAISDTRREVVQSVKDLMRNEGN